MQHPVAIPDSDDVQVPHVPFGRDRPGEAYAGCVGQQLGDAGQVLPLGTLRVHRHSQAPYPGCTESVARSNGAEIDRGVRLWCTFGLIQWQSYR